MADKILVIKVDPCCPCSYKKIKKILCKIQECEDIKTITYDEKNHTVKLSGPSDPQNLSRKILCKACRLIVEIKVEDAKPPPKKTPGTLCNDIEIVIKDKDPKCTVTKKVNKQCIPEGKDKKDCKEKKDCKDGKKPEIEINKVCNDIKIIVEDKCPDPPPCPPPCLPPCPPPCPPPCLPPCPPPCPPPPHCQKPPCPPPCQPPCKPSVCPVCCWTGDSVVCPGGPPCHSCGRSYGCVPDGPPLGWGGPSHGGGYRWLCEQESSASCSMM